MKLRMSYTIWLMKLIITILKLVKQSSFVVRKTTTRLYRYFNLKLGKRMTDSIGHPDFSQFRLVDKFMASNTANVKNAILKSFLSTGGRLMVLIATVAFGMGIDCPDIYRIIHWGPPSDLESYIQETRRAGHGGHSAYVTHYTFHPET